MLVREFYGKNMKKSRKKKTWQGDAHAQKSHPDG